jgi:hypothetical protein
MKEFHFACWLTEIYSMTITIKSKLFATIKKESRKEEYLALLKHQADKNKLQKAK